MGKHDRQRVDEYKLGQGCADCGYNAHPAALSFYSTDASIDAGSIRTQALTRGWETTLAMMQSCEVLCMNCHLVRRADGLPAT